ncbi:MAG: hypothetical protein Roseis2KO_24090 [Roseivirga sp.]
MLFGLLMFDGLAQEQYRAVFSGGRVYLSGNNKFTQVRNGQLIDPKAQIELVGNAQVVLMDNAGRLISLTLSGKYALEKLDLSHLGDSSRFVKTVWDTYYSDQEQSIEELLSTMQRNESTEARFGLWLPSSSQFYGDELTLLWSEGKEPHYAVELINEFGEVFETRQTNRPEMVLSMIENKLAWKDEITIRIKQPASSMISTSCSLDRLSPPDYEKLERLMDEHFQDEDFGVMLTKAAFFENQWLFADAITVLARLRKQKGALMEDYWEQYLIRNGFY